MPDKICYWDPVDGTQKERDATVEEQAVIDAARVAPSPVPTEITMRQARRALLQEGLLDDVQVAIDAQSSPTKEQAQIEWDYSSMVERHRDLVGIITSYLGWTEEETDDLFRLAATL